MKDFIVLAAMIILGIVIAGIIIGFKTQVNTIGQNAGSALTNIANQLQEATPGSTG